ncbi:MAG TPA: hypothetical protein VFJ16_07505 [Longimicrobium sp.]|nr:hypothetical protein [Longimicrobium sp.]
MKKPFLATACAVLLAACSDPSADEYAVWSAAVDAAFGGAPRTLAVIPDPEDGGAWLGGKEEDIRELRRLGLPFVMARNYVAVNHAMVRVRPSRFSTRRVTLLPPVPAVARRTLEAAGVSDGDLYVSRVGFDESGMRALVTVSRRPGPDGDRGVMMVVERGGDGRWRHATVLVEWKS